MENISYRKLKSKLQDVNLLICNLNYSFSDDGKPIFKGSIGANTLNDRPYLLERAAVGDIWETAFSPEEVINKLWAKIKKSKIWIGSYNSYSAVVEYDEKTDMLVKRELTKNEKIEMAVDSIY